MNLFNSVALMLCNQSLISQYNIYCKYEYQEKVKDSTDYRILHVINKEVVQDFNDKSSGRLIAAIDFIYRFNKINFSNLSLFRELINKYCAQTIFISSITPRIQLYSDKIIKMDTLTSKESRKKRMLYFNKALINCHIIVNTLFDSYIQTNKNQSIFLPIKFVWKKNLDFIQLFKNLIKKSQRDNTYKSSIELLNILQNVDLPLFTITNNLNQLVIAEPSEIVSMKNIIHKFPYYTSLSAQDQSRLYEGWFFVNPNDINEYKNYIISKYKRSYQQNGLNLFITGLHLYYRLNRTSASNIQFRLFPDLTEVGNLIMNSIYRSNIEFDRQQNYGKNYFQGQPLYFIKPVIHKSSISDKKSFIYCYYQIPEDSSRKKYYPIFLNRTVALNTWKKFREEMSKNNFSLPKNPVLHVYNLEDFLKDNEDDPYWVRYNFLLVPSDEVYNLIRFIQINHQNKIYHIFKIISPYLFWSKLWSKRIIWSLTNKRPPS